MKRYPPTPGDVFYAGLHDFEQRAQRAIEAGHMATHLEGCADHFVEAMRLLHAADDADEWEDAAWHFHRSCTVDWAWLGSRGNKRPPSTIPSHELFARADEIWARGDAQLAFELEKSLTLLPPVKASGRAKTL